MFIGDIVSIVGISGISIYGEVFLGVYIFGGLIVIGLVVVVRMIFVGNEGLKIGVWKEVCLFVVYEFVFSGNVVEWGCFCNNGDFVNI